MEKLSFVRNNIHRNDATNSWPRRKHFFYGATMLAALLFVLPGTARADCTVPDAIVGSLQWFSATLEFKYCDGLTWQTMSSTSSAWSTNGANLYYTSGGGKVGVGTAMPAVKMDVNGSIRFGNGGLTCSGGNNKGVFRYNTTTSAIEFCNGTVWASIAGPGTSTCTMQSYSSPGEYIYKVVAGCETLMIEAYGAGGGGASNNEGGGGGGGSSRVEDASNTILALGGGGGGGAYQSYYTLHGSGGGGGYGKKTVTLTAGDNLKIYVGQGGQNSCSNFGGMGGNPAGGLSGTNAKGGDSVYGGGGGGDYNYRGGSSTHGGGGGAGNSSNSASSTTNGGAGGSGNLSSGCGDSTNGGPCGHLGEGGGGGGGIGDVTLKGLAGDHISGGYAANGGPGIGGPGGYGCATRGGNGQVTIRPIL